MKVRSKGPGRTLRHNGPWWVSAAMVLSFCGCGDDSGDAARDSGIEIEGDVIAYDADLFSSDTETDMGLSDTGQADTGQADTGLADLEPDQSHDAVTTDDGSADTREADADLAHSSDADFGHADADSGLADADSGLADADFGHADADLGHADADLGHADANLADADMGSPGPREPFVAIGEGTFLMGSHPGEVGRDGDEERHEVTLTHGFWMQTTEVTQDAWEALMGNNPSYFAPLGAGTDCGGDCPVEWVNWYEALAYANALSQAAGLSSCYELTDCDGAPGTDMLCDAVSVRTPSGSVYDCEGYRLPTEAEFERAARANTVEATYNGNLTTTGCEPDDALLDIAWYCGNAAGTTHAVGQLEPNAFGLYDILGNVWEWTWDLEGPYSGDVFNPEGNTVGTNRIFRGGSYTDGARAQRAADRWSVGPGHNAPTLGFRLVRSMLRTDVLGDSFVRVANGTFSMGSHPGEPWRNTDEVRHDVTLTRDFFMQTTEVTQAAWESFMGNNPSYFGPVGVGGDCGGDCPVEWTNWYEALAYANALSAANGLPDCYELTDCDTTPGNDMVCTGVTVTAASGSVYDCEGFRLPTEAEFEFAARGGTTTSTYAGNPTASLCEADPVLTEIAWYCGNAAGTTHPVGLLDPNPYGLYDMLGNVWEWTWDFGDAYPGAVTDPEGPATGTARTFRGGSYDDSVQFQRSAERESVQPGHNAPTLGIRLVRSIF